MNINGKDIGKIQRNREPKAALGQQTILNWSEITLKPGAKPILKRSDRKTGHGMPKTKSVFANIAGAQKINTKKKTRSAIALKRADTIGSTEKKCL